MTAAIGSKKYSRSVPEAVAALRPSTFHLRSRYPQSRNDRRLRRLTVGRLEDERKREKERASRRANRPWTCPRMTPRAIAKFPHVTASIIKPLPRRMLPRKAKSCACTPLANNPCRAFDSVRAIYGISPSSTAITTGRQLWREEAVVTRSELLSKNARGAGQTWKRESVFPPLNEYTNHQTRRGEASPRLFSLDDEGAEVMARVSPSYLAEAIYHCFFSRCLANVRGIRTASPSHRPRSVTAPRDRSARPCPALIWPSSTVPSDSSRLSRVFGVDGHSDREQWSAILRIARGADRHRVKIPAS